MGWHVGNLHLITDPLSVAAFVALVPKTMVLLDIGVGFTVSVLLAMGARVGRVEGMSACSTSSMAFVVVSFVMFSMVTTSLFMRFLSGGVAIRVSGG